MDQILADIERLKKVCDNVGLFVSDQTSQIVVRFSLDTSFLAKFTAKQWGIHPKKPIIIQLKFEWDYTKSEDIPAVFIFQSEDPHLNNPTLKDYETEFGVVEFFLSTRITDILRRNWAKRPVTVESGSSSSSSTTSSAPPLQHTKSLEDITDSIVIDQKLVTELISLGFERQKAELALKRCTNDWESALNALLTNQNLENPQKDEPNNKGSNNNNNNNTTTIIDLTNHNNNNNNSINTNNNNNNMDSTSDQKDSKKRPLSTSVDGPKLASLINLGFGADIALQALQENPAGELDKIVEYILEGKVKPPTNNNNNNTNNNKNTIEDKESPFKKTKADEKKKKDDEVDVEKISILVALGHSEGEATIALQASLNDVEKAIEFLEPQKSKDKAGRYDYEEEEEDFPRYARGGRLRGKRAFAAAPAFAFGIQPQVAPTPTPFKKVEEKIVDTTMSRHDEEVSLWEPDTCFLVALYTYISTKFIMCPNFCLICDKNMDISPLKLPVCDDKNCMRVYESTACGGNVIVTEIKEQPFVVELLLNFLNTCATGTYLKGWNRGGVRVDDSETANPNGMYLYGGARTNNNESFEPFPYSLGFDHNDGTQNVKLLCQTLDLIPAINIMNQFSSDDQLKVFLDDISPLCFPLLRWVLRSSRSHLSRIPEHKQLECMGTPFQFQIVSTNPEHERRFQQWKNTAKRENPNGEKSPNPYAYNAGLFPFGGFGYNGYNAPPPPPPKKDRKDATGSFYAFHGSPITNWHSIVRSGLRGGHVPGIYMAQAAATSHGYMAVGASNANGWKNSSWGCDKNISCIGLCEVADMTHKTELITGGSPLALQDNQLVGIVNVAMNYTTVVVRYLFFYPTGPGQQQQQAHRGRRAHNPLAIYPGGAYFNGVIACKIIENEFLFLDEKEWKPEKDKEEDISKLT
eukprot:TRINITY_DN3109_c0_g1_i1.p1 TRINITY_DN3109_c0_g1~~TRINITY_DN3109_c0_g1_i1.p1  ORF type:complete len:918 (-),score=250.47 TRINITY_DN3109_c0_g1_i1:134-2887(-)